MFSASGIGANLFLSTEDEKFFLACHGIYSSEEKDFFKVKKSSRKEGGHSESVRKSKREEVHLLWGLVCLN